MNSDLYEEYKLRDDLAVREGRKSLIKFVKYVKRDYQANWHHIKIANTLDTFIKDPNKKNLAIFIPPQHGKTELSTRNFPAYALGLYPDLAIAICSYSSDLASSFNRDIQRIIDSDEYAKIFPNTQINSKNVVTTQSWLRNSEIFEVVGRKGFLKSVGVGGGLSGRPVKLGIIDDPVKDEMEAQSATFRERVWQWYISVFLSRMHNDSKQILIMTRWHEDDLGGRLLNPLINPKWAEWEVLKIPAILEEETEGDPRKIGEALWPEKHSVEKMESLKMLGPDNFQSLYQQEPTARGGNKIKKELIKWVDSCPVNYIRPEIMIDGAYTDKKKNDPTGILEYKYDAANNTLYIMNFVNVRMESPELMEYLANYMQANNVSKGEIEPKANGLSIIPMLNKFTKYPFTPIVGPLVQAGKEGRFQYFLPYVESGKIVFTNNSGCKELINQIASYPKAKHDEGVDLLGYACQKYFMPFTSIFTAGRPSENLM